MCSIEPTRREAIRLATFGTVGLLAVSGCGQSFDSVQTGPAAGVRPAVPASPSLPGTSDDMIEMMPGLQIHRRAAWGADLLPKSSLERETVRFLLVHHTASSNNYDDPRTVIRSAYGFHTSASKGWGDVAYHFFVARDGSVWEGRSGSLEGPVVADATGGNQGWAQLVCLIGNHVDQPPTAAAQASLVNVLKWLAWRYRLDADAGATATYVSRGSNKLASGTTVTTPIISGHRDATLTACPGDAAYDLLPTWRNLVSAMPDPAFPQSGPYPPAARLGVIEP